jgi:hypothetical protein
VSGWLRFLFGLEEGEVPSGSDARWELSGMPHGASLAAALVLVGLALALVVLVYRRERGLGTVPRLLLTSLRLGALAVVVLMLLNPRLLVEIQLHHPGKSLVLFDASASMGQRDDLEGDERDRIEAASGLDLADRPTRTELAVAAIGRASLLEKLGEQNRLQLFAFAEELRSLSALQSAADVEPRGGETRLGAALREVLARPGLSQAGKQPLAAVVVVSDGKHNGGESPLEVVRGLAGRGRVPVHTVGVGKVELVKNYAVKELAAPKVAEVGYPLQVEARVLVSGIPGPVKASLHRQSLDGGSRVLVEERELDPRGSILETQLRFIDQLPRKGRYRYTLELPRSDEEVDPSDNQKTVAVTAAEEKRRLLLVAGAPSREYQFLRSLTIRDDGIQVSCWLGSADHNMFQDGDVLIDRLPDSVEALREYDVVALLDPSPEDLADPFVDGLVRVVIEDGGGLVYVCGEAHTRLLAAEARLDPLVGLLPVDVASAAQLTGAEVYSQPWRALLTAQGQRHPLCRLVDDPEAAVRLWSRLPPLYFAYPARRLRPAAVVLLQAGGGGVFAALHRVGMGEVLYVGSDETWQWRAAGESLHERFWAGVVRYLALGKGRAQSRGMTVETDRDRYREGDKVEVRVRLISGPQEASALPRLEASVVREPDAEESRDGASGGERWTVHLGAEAAHHGRYRGVFAPPRAGRYRVQLEPDAEESFEVERAGGEIEDPVPDFDLLGELARESGGTFVTLDALQKLPAEIPPTRVTEVLGKRAATVWDSAALMGLFCGLLVVEWVLRKLWRLN